jgi:hypothetical protein
MAKKSTNKKERFKVGDEVFIKDEKKYFAMILKEINKEEKLGKCGWIDLKSNELILKTYPLEELTKKAPPQPTQLFLKRSLNKRSFIYLLQIFCVVNRPKQYKGNVDICMLPFIILEITTL